MNQALGVHSEVGQLRQAIVHRPGLELSRLTPDNCEELLFDDMLWASKAGEEHDVFAQTLTDHGVHVHHFDTLLAETLAIGEALAAWITSDTPPPGMTALAPDRFGPLSDEVLVSRGLWQYAHYYDPAGVPS